MNFSIAIVIPTLNEAGYIGRCLGALSQLEYPKEKIKIYVVDNGSVDQTIEIASGFNVNIIKAPKQTIAYSRNVGAFCTDSDLIAFIDADCLIAPLSIKKAVSHFLCPDVVAAGSYPSVLESESNLLQITWSNLCRKTDEGICFVDWLPSANLIVRSEGFKLIKGFNESLTTCEDVDLGYRLKGYGKIIYDPQILVYHLREPRNFFEFFKKEFWHAKNNISGVFSHGLKFSEIPSLIGPLLFGAGLIVGINGLIFSNTTLTIFFLLSLIVWILYTLKGYLRVKNLIMTSSIYFIYFLARSLAEIREIITLLLRCKQVSK